MVRVVDGDSDLVPRAQIPVGDDLVVADEGPRVHRAVPDEPNHGEPAGIDPPSNRRPVALDGPPPKGSQSPEQRRDHGVGFGRWGATVGGSQLEAGVVGQDGPQPQTRRQAEPIERLDLPVDEPPEAGRSEWRRFPICRRENTGLPEVADDEAHPPAEPLTRIADAEPPGVERSEAKGRTGRPGVLEVKAVDRGPKVADAGTIHGEIVG